MSKLEPAAQRVQDALRAKRPRLQVRHMDRTTRTAEQAAAACGCAVGQIVKSLVFRGARSGKPYLLLVSGANRVDEKRVAAHIGEPLERPDAALRARGHRLCHRRHPAARPRHPARDLHGRGAAGLRRVWAAAGTPDAVFPIAPAQLAEAAAAVVIPVA